MPPESLASLFDRTEQAIWIITANSGESRGGLVATFVSRASIVPDLPRLLAGLDNRHETRALIERSGAFAAHLVRNDQTELVWRFGLQSSREVDKFAGLEAATARTGAPILVDTLAWLDCRVENQMDTGDRTIYLAEVLDGRINGGDHPLCLDQLVRAGPPENVAVMRKQLADDAALDREAIVAWRKQRS